MPEPDHLHSLCRLRSTLEAFAMRHWPGGAARARLRRELRRRLEELRRCAVQGDYEAFHTADRQWHRAAVNAAGLPPLLKSWEIVSAELDAWILEVKHAYWPNLMALYREHELLLQACFGGDAEAAEQALHQHLEAGWHRRMMAGERAGAELDAVERAVSFIATHYARQLDVEWLAANVSFVSTSHLGRLFRRRMKTTPLRHLKQVRMERAAQLLCSGAEAVAVVARRVGYRNTSHFVRDFRRMFGVTPLDYRRRERA